METSREVFFLDLVRVFNPGICEGLAGAQQRLVSVQVAEGIGVSRAGKRFLLAVQIL